MVTGDTHPRILTDSRPAHSRPAVAGSLTRTITVAAVAQGDVVAVVAVGAWASGAAALGRSSGAASLRDFGVSRDLSLDDLIRPHQHRLRDRQPEGLRGLQVDHQLELGGLLDGQVGRLRSSQDAIDLGD